MNQRTAREVAKRIKRDYGRPTGNYQYDCGVKRRGPNDYRVFFAATDIESEEQEPTRFIEFDLPQPAYDFARALGYQTPQ